ncbi:MAG: TonB-dependent receptor [Vicinamibacterales bacterium]
MQTLNSTTPGRPTRRCRGRRLAIGTLAGGLLALPLSAGMRADTAREGQTPPCAIRGFVTTGQVRLPGVGLAVTPKTGGPDFSTSTGQDGSYSVVIPGPGTYTVVADLTGFAPVTLDIVVDASCQAQHIVTLTLASRVEAPKPATPAGAAAAEAPAAPARAADRRQAPAPFRGTVGSPAGAPGQPEARAGQGEPAGQPTGVSAADESLEIVAAQLSLPPGFSVGTSGDSLTAAGAAGQVNPMLFMMTGEGGPGGGRGGEGMFGGMGGFGPDGQPVGMSGMGGEPGGFVAGGFPQGGGPGGSGPGGGGMGGPGGGGMGGRGGGPGIAGRLAMAGGRGGANRIRLQASYNLSGSPFDAAPYPLTANTGEEPSYLNQRLTVNIGGPFKIPGIYKGKTGESFFLNYNGGFGGNLYESYSIVPTAAWRAGDFSGANAALIDPLTGLPFPANQIPASRIDPAALALLQYYPLPNQPGDAKNYYRSATTGNRSDDINFRFTKSFSAVPGAPGGAGGRGGGAGRGGGRGGSNLSFGVQYRRTDIDRNSAFQTTSGSSKGGSWNVPVTYTFNKKGLFNTLNVQYNRARSESTNLYAYQRDVAGEAGIAGVSTDPFSWGIPSLSFTSVSGLRDQTPTIRTDQTLTIRLNQMKPYKRHSFRWGGDFRWMLADSRTDSNPRGSFVFTGLYTGYAATPGAGTRSTGTGLDFADFLLGMSQQATLNYGPGTVRFRSRAWSLFFQDDWRVNARFTINAGLRYEYLTPYWEANDSLVNLDANADFTAVTPVIAGQAGPYTGAYPTSAVDPDRNNLAPRTGVAWRLNSKTVVRGGYGISYSSPVYQSMAQRMSAQPPFATTDTRLGELSVPLMLTSAFATPTPPAVVTNNFGVGRHYALGWLQMWNVDLQRDLARTVSAGVGYAGTRGSSLDIQRAPNRGANGVAIADVQPFIWEESGGHSIMHALSVRLQKRPSKGIGAGISYTLSKSRDNASTLGGGGGTVAQDDKDLEAEWGASSFDQRHRLAANVNLELPFGRNRRWLQTGPGELLLGGWNWTVNFTLASGSPFTARVTGAAANVAQGLNGTLRANYNGEPIQVDDPTMQRFFNTGVFSIPPTGSYGNSARNIIVGPGTQATNMSLQKIIMLPSSRSITVRAQATNIFNNVQWGSIDTVVNSPTFGQVTSVRSMRSVTFSIRAGF